MNSARSTSPNAATAHSGVSPKQTQRHHPVRSPSDPLSSVSTSKSKSPSPDGGRSERKRSSNAVNGDARAKAVNGQDDSEAETIHLSDEDQGKPKRNKRAMKSERDDSVGISSPPLTARSEPVRGHASSRDSSLHPDRSDRDSEKRNGHGGKQNGVRSVSAKAAASNKARILKDADSKARAHSAEAATPPTGEATGRAKSVEPRKRKFSDARPSKLEPPRQRPRLDSTLKTSSPTSRTAESTSPPASASSNTKTHKRSTSAQSSAPNAPPRTRRAPPSDLDSSSEASSPRTKPTTLLAPPSSKLTGRALTSPARLPLAHGKKTDKYGQTALARACEKGNLAAVKSAYDQAPDELDYADNSGVAPLQNAALKGYADIVEFLLAQGCRKDCRSGNNDTPLIDAVENGHLDVVKLLLKHGVNPHHQNEKGQRAVDLIDEEDENAAELELLLQQAMRDYEGPDSDDDAAVDEPKNLPLRRGERKDLLHKDTTTASLREYAQRGDLEAVDYFLNMRVKPDNDCAVVAARGGHSFVLNLLLADLADKDPNPADYEDTPMLAAIGRGHLKVIRALLDLPEFNPRRKTREGKTYWEVSEERRGPRWQAERDLLKERYEQYRPSSHAKSGKKHRPPQEPVNHTRSNSGSKLELLTSPKLGHKPKLKQEKAEVIEKVDERQKQKRILANKEMPLKEKKVRRRRVVHDDDSSFGSSDDDVTDVRPPSKQERKRKNSTASKSFKVEKEKEKEHTSPRLRHDKIDKDRRPVRKATLSDSPKSERHRRSDAAEKSQVKEGTPESSREARRAAEKAEAEKKQREKEELEAKKAEEERRRQEEEEARKAEEERLRREEEARIAEQKRKEEEARRAAEAKRRERLESLPAALRYALELEDKRPQRFTRGTDRKSHIMGIKFNFLPLLYWPLQHIDAGCDETRRNEKWIMSFQVVGLLGLPELHLEEFPLWEKRPVPQEQKEYFLRGYPIDKLAQYYQFPDDAPTIEEANQDLDECAQLLERTKQQFRKMEPLFYVRLEDVLEKAKEYKHLDGLNLPMIHGPKLRRSDRPRWSGGSDCDTDKNSPDRVTASVAPDDIKKEQSIPLLNTDALPATQLPSTQINGSIQDAVSNASDAANDASTKDKLADPQDVSMTDAPGEAAAVKDPNGPELKAEPDKMDET